MQGNFFQTDFDFFKDMKVSNFICGRSMIAVVAAPLPKVTIEPPIEISLKEDEQPEVMESSSEQSDFFKLESSPEKLEESEPETIIEPII